MKTKITLLLLLINIIAFSQKQRIDTLSFSTKTTLLTFTGKINNVETQFAFDTGAAFGVLNSESANIANVKIKSNKKITDSNEKSTRINSALIDEVTIGSFKINKVKSVVFDMPVLFCNKIYLLGGDVINQLNWKIDFNNEKIYVSDQPFKIENELLTLPKKIKSNRHFTELKVNGKPYNTLVDFGFTGFFETNYEDHFFGEFLEKSSAKKLTFESKITAMGLTSTQIGVKTSLFTTNAVSINDLDLKNFRVSMSTNDKEPKLGLNFFKSIASILIINKKDDAYFIKIKSKEVDVNNGPDARFFLKDGKIIVVSIIENEASSAKGLQINEEIKSIDSRAASSFIDECDFITWNIKNNQNEFYNIEKLNGDKIRIIRQKIPVE